MLLVHLLANSSHVDSGRDTLRISDLLLLESQVMMLRVMAETVKVLTISADESRIVRFFTLLLHHVDQLVRREARLRILRCDKICGGLGA